MRHGFPMSPAKSEKVCLENIATKKKKRRKSAVIFKATRSNLGEKVHMFWLVPKNADPLSDYF